jgi:hypothetical protein
MSECGKRVTYHKLVSQLLQFTQVFGHGSVIHLRRGLGLGCELLVGQLDQGIPLSSVSCMG